jgi:serine O-acetyltransferase
MQSPITLLQTIREDLTAHRGEWSRPGFQSLAVHRFGNWQKTIKNKTLRAPFYAAAKALHVFTRNFYGIELPFEAKIGRRVVFEHQHGIVVHGNAKIGDDCVIRQGVTLGIRSMDAVSEAPWLLPGTDVGAGAKILGMVIVGPNAKVGANAVVVKDIPRDSTAVGIPAKIIESQPEKARTSWVGEGYWHV